MRGRTVIAHDFLLFILRLSVRASHARHGFPPDALFRRHVRRITVSGDALPESRAMRLFMGFLPRRRVASSDVRGSEDGRVKPAETFVSLLQVQLQESPPSLQMFHFSPYSSNFICFPDFWYISFDFVRLGSPIGIDSMFSFQFGPLSFNFRIGLKRMNLFSTVVLISSFFPFD